MKATYLSELYKDFLYSVHDYTFISIPDEQLQEDLEYYLKKAIDNFHKCKQRLDTIVDADGEEYFGYTEIKSGKEELVKVKLTGLEKNILTHLMLVEYLKPQLITSELLKPSMGDKGFKIYSQANHIRELSLLYRTIQRECNKKITEYTYLDLGEEKWLITMKN